MSRVLIGGIHCIQIGPIISVIVLELLIADRSKKIDTKKLQCKLHP